MHHCKKCIVKIVPTLVVHALAFYSGILCSAKLPCKAVTLLQYVLQVCSTHKRELCLAAQGLLCLIGCHSADTAHAACCNLLLRYCAILVGMATALQPVTLKRGDEQLLKFRAGTKVDTIVHGLATVCPGGRIEDSEGFVVTLGYVENLTEKEYTVIDPTPAGPPCPCKLHFHTVSGAVADVSPPDTPTQLHPAFVKSSLQWHDSASEAVARHKLEVRV